MAKEKPFDPVFDRDSGNFADNPYEKKEESKNSTEIYWVPPLALGVFTLITFGGFLAASWPIVVPIILGGLCLLSIAAIPFLTNSK